MSKKQQLIDFVLGNDFIVKPSLRNQFELMLNDAICESSSNWISVNERLPEIDTADEWNKQNKITKNVICWSKEWGMRFGRYFYLNEFWTIDGVHSSNGIRVEYWTEVKPPIQ